MKYARANWGLFLLFVMCAIVYRPWNAPHLPLTDFGVFLEARGPSQNMFSQFVSLTSYYVSEGRLCLITFFYLVAGSEAFGTWAPGWHWTYFVLNSIVLALAWNLFARIGINRLTTFVVLALWSLMGPTAELWIRPAGEPVALIFFLVALGKALNFADAQDWKRRTVIIAICAAGIILSKELLVVLLPAGWLFSRLRFREGTWSWASWQRRDTYLLSVVAVVAIALMVPVISVMTHGHKSSYAGQYGLSAMSWSSLLNRLELTLIPAAPRLHWLEGIASDPAWTLVRVLPNLMWVATVAISAAVVKKGKFAWPAAFGLLWAMTGVLAYLPWPGQGLFYMMPFAAGTMFLAAHALNGPLARGNKNRRPVFLISAALILVASLEARSTIDQHRLRANLNAGVIAEIARHGGTNLLIAAVPDPKPGTGGWSDHLRGFGEVEKGTRVIEWRDVACSEARRALDSIRGAIVVSTGGGCNELSDHSVVIADSVPRVIWPYIWKRTESQGRMYVAYAAAGRQLNDVVSMNNHD